MIGAESRPVVVLVMRGDHFEILKLSLELVYVGSVHDFGVDRKCMSVAGWSRTFL